ncbi:MAG: choice-of-anchor L domain-containing protein, partial [Polyangiaceae bacterium]|nr:choice-of-anchor L domain-containing protein [Polyangiaceae bacterium]
CNDCDPNVNPGAIEVVITEPVGDAGVPEPADEDCDGTVDNPPQPCDDNLAVDDSDPMHGAWAVDLCQQATAGGHDWGVLSAQYVRANGSAAGASLQSGILGDFGSGVNVQGGHRMLALSSGRARLPSQSGACGSLSCYGFGVGSAPAGFPQDVPGCAGDTEINDDVALEVHLRAPMNATGYKFNFKFYSFEYPEWVCTSFNDQFISLVSPPPAGSINGNVSFDSQTNPVSVNVAFFDVCSGCPLGTGELAGTGFDTWDDAGGTSWLVSTAPISGGEEFSIRWAIWDTGDQAWDSTALVDNFQWIANGGTVVVGTEPEPLPQ